MGQTTQLVKINNVYLVYLARHTPDERVAIRVSCKWNKSVTG
jgi:hypothetical protein